MRPLDLPQIPLPPNWNQHAKRGILAVFTLAHFTITAVRAWGNSNLVPGVRRELRIERLENEVALLREQLRILHARYAKIDPMSRPHYVPADPFAILALKETRGWSIARVAREFQLSADHRQLAQALR